MVILSWRYSLEIEMVVLEIEGARYLQNRATPYPALPTFAPQCGFKESRSRIWKTGRMRHAPRCLAPLMPPLSKLGPGKKPRLLLVVTTITWQAIATSNSSHLFRFVDCTSTSLANPLLDAIQSSIFISKVLMNSREDSPSDFTHWKPTHAVAKAARLRKASPRVAT